MFYKTMGERIRMRRKSLGLTQSQLAELMGVQTGAVGTWERGEFAPRGDAIERLAKVLDMSYADLIVDEGDSGLPQRDDAVPASEIIPLSDFAPVPVIDIRACAGLGTSHEYEDIEVERTIPLPAQLVGAISPDADRRPFAVHIDGDSMSVAGLYDGMLAIINPVEEVHSGDAALVCFGERQDVAIKYVFYHQDGGIEIRSASEGYPIHRYTRDDLAPVGDMPPIVRIIGRVMGVWGTPKRG